MKRETAIQVFATLAIIVGLVVSYYPPKINGEAIWALVGGFLGYAVRYLFEQANGAIEGVLDFKPGFGGSQSGFGGSQSGFVRPSLCLAMAAGALVLISGCSMLPATFDQAEERLATAVVQSSERTICRNIPVATWMRLYGSNPERLKGWQSLCLTQSVAPTDKAVTAEALKAYDLKPSTELGAGDK